MQFCHFEQLIIDIKMKGLWLGLGKFAPVEEVKSKNILTVPIFSNDLDFKMYLYLRNAKIM